MSQGTSASVLRSGVLLHILGRFQVHPHPWIVDEHLRQGTQLLNQLVRLLAESYSPQEKLVVKSTCI